MACVVGCRSHELWANFVFYDVNLAELKTHEEVEDVVAAFRFDANVGKVGQFCLNQSLNGCADGLCVCAVRCEQMPVLCIGNSMQLLAAAAFSPSASADSKGDGKSGGRSSPGSGHGHVLAPLLEAIDLHSVRVVCEHSSEVRPSELRALPSC